MNTGNQKKSEMLEVRVSYGTKSALKDRAHAERRSVSDIVRSLISDYLVGDRSKRDEESRAPDGTRWIDRPRLAITSLLASAGIVLALQQVGHAQNVALELDGTFVQEDSGIHSFGTQVQLEYGVKYDLSIDDEEGYVCSITASEANSDEGDVLLALEIWRVEEGQDVVIGRPDVHVSFDRSARLEFLGTDGGFYGVTFRARPVKAS